ncbi:hypothetical protein DESUT3_02000 [Desulfuromonas versatilis]|uniref:Uncharacterized protein n=1 Tax=Desulfuromonas versatilis TaxID=2802975 RepID=A0ABN6DVF2_9BACT|nr:hypothetical protein DESUT3_02000 [Desulfuromonas versatilis]
MNPAGSDGVAQGPADVFLSDQILKALGPPLAGQYQIRHGATGSPLIGGCCAAEGPETSIAGTSDSQAPPRHTAEAAAAAPFRA